MKLSRSEICVGKDRATKHVVYLAKALDISVPKHREFKRDILLKTEKKNFRINFSEEVEHTIKHGKANMLQAWFDAEDRFLQPAIEMASFGSVPGITFTMTSSLGSHTATVSNHGILESPEIALAKDICFFHRETCELYNSGDISGFSRSFRGFLHSCVSLVDCFLFRYAFHVRDLIGDTSQYLNTLTLDSRAGVLERMDAWMQTFAANEMMSFKDWKERSQFIELKNKRNEFTHPSVPTVVFEPVDVAKYLNYGSTGVGKLLGRMRKASSVTDKIGFIHQVSHLPKVTIKRTGG